MDNDDDTLVEAILNITNINLSMRLLCLLERICRNDVLIQTIINNRRLQTRIQSRIRLQTTISELRSRIQDPINYELRSRIQDINLEISDIFGSP